MCNHTDHEIRAKLKTSHMTGGTCGPHTARLELANLGYAFNSSLSLHCPCPATHTHTHQTHNTHRPQRELWRLLWWARQWSTPVNNWTVQSFRVSDSTTAPVPCCNATATSCIACLSTVQEKKTAKAALILNPPDHTKYFCSSCPSAFVYCYLLNIFELLGV